MPDVFVSYSRKDKAFVEHLHKALANIGRETWIDWQSIPPTAAWLAEIRAAIEAADNFVFVVSPDSVASKVCREEINHAILHRKRLLPIVSRDVDPANVPSEIASLNWIFFREIDDFESSFHRLIKALDTDLAWVKEHTRLLVRALQWDNSHRNSALLLRGSDLTSSESWLAAAAMQKDMRPTPIHVEFVTASRRGATTRLRVILSAVGFGALIAIVLAALAFRESKLAKQQAQRADTNAKTAEKNAEQHSTMRMWQKYAERMQMSSGRSQSSNVIQRVLVN